MICNPTNYKPHKSVYDVETKPQFHNVVSIDTETGEVTLCNFRNSRVLETIRFETIYAIPANCPIMFHCYGRKES